MQRGANQGPTGLVRKQKGQSGAKRIRRATIQKPNGASQESEKGESGRNQKGESGTRKTSQEPENGNLGTGTWARDRTWPNELGLVAPAARGLRPAASWMGLGPGSCQSQHEDQGLGLSPGQGDGVPHPLLDSAAPPRVRLLSFCIPLLVLL